MFLSLPSINIFIYFIHCKPISTLVRSIRYSNPRTPSQKDLVCPLRVVKYGSEDDGGSASCRMPTPGGEIR